MNFIYFNPYAMKLEDQVVSLELAKKLKELGVSQDSYFNWVCEPGYYEGEWVERHHRTNRPIIASAFTVAELGEMLPPGYRTQKEADMWLAIASRHVISTDREFALGANTEADARAEMLIYLIEKNIVKP